MALLKQTEKNYKAVVNEWFINGFNGVKAWQKVYPDANDNTANAHWQRIKNIECIKVYIQKKEKKSEESAEITHQEMTKILRSWLDSDITQYMNLTVKEVQELPIEVRKLITSFEQKKEYLFMIEGERVYKEFYKITFVSKEKAAEMLQKHIGYYSKDNEQSRPQTINYIDLGGGEPEKV